MARESSWESLAPERVAAAARELEPRVLEAIALMADALADDLAERLQMVAWEREEQIGDAQRRLLELAELRFAPAKLGGDPVRVRELRRQPLDALAVAWEALRRGRRVHLESEAGACPGAFRLAREFASLLPAGALTISAPGQLDHPQARWSAIGVEPSRARVALIQTDADPELAAYILTRACLRRTGFDPRVAHHVIVVGGPDRLLRNLRRLWVGARMGPVDDERAFSGPVDDDQARAYFAAERAWREREEVTTICPGDRLQRADAPQACFLAPALFRAPSFAGREDDEGWLAAMPDCAGPMLVVHPIAPGPAERAMGEELLTRLSAGGEGHLRFGDKPRELALRAIDSQVHGALLVERLPPGLPEPRP